MLRELPPTAGLPLKWSDFLPNGSSLEDLLAKFINAPRTTLLSSGTACLVVILNAMKRLQPLRTEVVVSAYTCPLVAIAVHQAGLELRLCDLDPNSLEINRNHLREVLGANTLCVVAAHLGGIPCAIDPINVMARAAGAYVVEDAAQALGATWKGHSVGLRGDASFFSLTVGKGLTIYEGGFIVSTNDELSKMIAEVARTMTRSNPIAEMNACCHLAGYKLLYNPLGLHLAYGEPLRKHLARGNIELALGDVFPRQVPIRSVGSLRRNIGAAAFSRLNIAILLNKQRALKRVRRLEELEHVTVLQEPENASGSWPFLMLLMDSKESCDKALSQLWTRGLGVTKLFATDLTGYNYLKDIVENTAVPNATSFAQRCLTISNSELVTDNDFERICDVLRF